MMEFLLFGNWGTKQVTEKHKTRHKREMHFFFGGMKSKEMQGKILYTKLM